MSDTIRAFLLPYAAHFRQQGWRVDAASAATAGAGLDAHFDAVHDIPWSRSLHDLRNITRAGRTVRSILMRNRYDIVHTHTPIASFVGRAACRTLPAGRRPAVVYTAHGFHFHAGGRGPANVAYQVAEKVAGRWCDRVVVINDDDLRAARRLGLARGRVAHFPGIGIDLDRYRPTDELREAAAGVRRRLGVGTGDTLVAMVAEMVPNKNHTRVLRALAATADPRPHLVLVGDGPLRPALEAEAAGLGLASRVHFAGLVDDVRPWVLASAATVLVSGREGLPRSVLESLALGVPVIGSRVRGITQLVGGDGGILVAAGDERALGAALGRLARGDVGPLPPSVADRLEPYAEAHVVGLHQDLYGELLGAAAGPGPGATGKQV